MAVCDITWESRPRENGLPPDVSAHILWICPALTSPTNHASGCIPPTFSTGFANDSDTCIPACALSKTRCTGCAGTSATATMPSSIPGKWATRRQTSSYRCWPMRAKSPSAVAKPSGHHCFFTKKYYGWACLGGRTSGACAACPHSGGSHTCCLPSRLSTATIAASSLYIHITENKPGNSVSCFYVQSNAQVDTSLSGNRQTI